MVDVAEVSGPYPLICRSFRGVCPRGRNTIHEKSFKFEQMKFEIAAIEISGSKSTHIPPEIPSRWFPVFIFKSNFIPILALVSAGFQHQERIDAGLQARGLGYWRPAEDPALLAELLRQHRHFGEASSE